MERGVEDLAGVTAALSRAAGNALDPASVLDRTMAVLAPVIDLGGARLWRTARTGDLELVATYEAKRGGVAAAEPPDPEPVASGLDEIDVLVESRGHPLGRLVARSGSGEPFTRHAEALIDIAATQIGGALERLDLFTEVMELERLKSDFIARVSHELRTPITIISGFLETLIAHDMTLDSERRLHMLDRSRVAASRLGSLIEQLLTLSRLEGGVLTPKPAPVSLASVFDSVRTSASERDQVLLIGATDDTVVTDGALLGQALALIVDNAITYGGVAELSAEHRDDRWVIEVRDRGPGFAADIRDTAFEMFARSPNTAVVAGLGVGLAIARTIIEVLDGTIEIDDATPGPGAVVRVTIGG